MGDNVADSSGAAENIVEHQDPEFEPVKLIPEGFVVDDSLPSIFLEDFEGNNEIWLVDVPAAVDPLKLIGKQLDFRQETSFLIDERTNEKCVSVPSDGPYSAICLFSSQLDNTKKIVSLNTSGKINININYDVPAFGAMIPDGTSVPLPVGLKVRHPFLGSVFKHPVRTMETPSKKDVVLELQRKSKPVVKEHISPDVSPAKKVPRESLNEMAVKNEVLTPKKSKKRKRELLDDDGKDTAHESFSVSPVHLSKKHKKEMSEESIVLGKTEFLGSAISNEVMELSVKEAISVKRSKKDKKRASAMFESELNAAASLEEAGDASGTQQIQKKKIKEEHRWSGEGEGVMVVSLEESPKKAKKKKKRESEILTVVEQSDELPSDTVVVGEESSRTSGNVKDVKKGLHKGLSDRILDVSCEGDAAQEVGLHERKIKKEKSKKRQTLGSMETEAVSSHPDSLGLSIGSKREEFVERQSDEEQLEVLHEGGDNVKKKKKKDKRESSVKSGDLDVEVWRGEVGAIPETLELTPKKKIKEERKLSLKSEGSPDISSVETLLTFEVGVETSKKSKKKKKRDSEIGDGAGQSNVMPDIVLIDGTPDKTPSREKKIKKEIKREMDRSILQVSHEEGNAEKRKSKKRHTLDNADMGALYAGLSDQGMILGRKGIEGMGTVNEELEVHTEASEHVKKKRKKDKKRESELVRNELDVEVMKAEVDVIPVTPEQTPKKKKKKVKEEHGSSLNAEGMADVLLVEPSMSSESGDGSSKKAKKKKKRESEYGNGVELGGFPADIVKLEEFIAPTSEAVGKSKKEKWFIDCEPSNVPSDSFKGPPEGKKKKKVRGEAGINAEHGDEISSVSNILNSDSKKSKRRHTMDVADASALISDQNRMNLLPGVKIEGKSHHKKRQSLMAEGMGAQLISPKKEKKIKKESLG